MAKKEHLGFFSENCKRCKHLFPSETRSFKICHYKFGNNGLGNEFCPAADLQIVIVGRAMRWAKLVLTARSGRDAVVEARILSKVSKESQAFKERFYFYLENGVK